MKNKLYVVLDNVRSRENVGSIFRTADAAGVSKIYLCGITPTPMVENSNNQIPNSKQVPNSKLQIQNSDKIAKTALGAQNWIPWEYHKQTWRLLKNLKQSRNFNAIAQKLRIYIIALEQTKKSKNIFKFKVPKNCSIVLVVGNEVKGLSPKILKYCDKKVFIPMYGKKESLNVAVAFGICVYLLRH